MPELDGQPSAPASETPATPAFDPEAFKSSLVAELNTAWESKMNERVSGLMSTYQKQINEKDEQLRELQLGSMSEEERDSFREQEAQQYLDDLEFKVWLAQEANSKHPKAAPHIQKLYEMNGDVASFAEYLESVLNPAPATPEPEPATTVPDVDPNSPAPASTAGSFVMPNGQVLTKELADQLLRSFGDTPIAQLRGG